MTAKPIVRLDSAASIATSIPYLLGFVPADSAVIVSVLSEPARKIGPILRLDLDAGLEGFDDLLNQSVRALGRLAEVEAVMVVIFSSTPHVLEQERANVFLARFYQTMDTFRVHGHHLYYEAGDHSECSHALIEEVDSPVDEELLKGGLDFVESREQMAAKYAEDPTLGLAVLPLEPVGDPALAMARALADPDHITNEDLSLILYKTHTGDYTEVMATITKDVAEAHHKLWTQAVRVIHTKESAVLGAIAAWQCGRGADANILIDIAQAEEPTNGLIRMLMAMLELPPHEWEPIRVNLTVD